MTVAGGAGRGRIAAAFAACRAERRGAFVPYLTSGFPSFDESERLAGALLAEGADLLELGVPFSDPLADGPVIQETTRIALEAGATLDATLDLAARLRATAPTPIVLMTYVNPVARFGPKRFAARATAAGVDGVILVDLPPEEEPSLWDALDRAGLDTITLVAPTTAAARLPAIAARARGFLYVVARLGVTGAGSGARPGESALPALRSLLDRCRDATPLPRCLGFGFAPDTDLAPYRGHAEGIVAGSSLLEPLLASHAKEGAAGADRRERILRDAAARFRTGLAGWRDS